MGKMFTAGLLSLGLIVAPVEKTPPPLFPWATVESFQPSLRNIAPFGCSGSNAPGLTLWLVDEVGVSYILFSLDQPGQRFAAARLTADGEPVTIFFGHTEEDGRIVVERVEAYLATRHTGPCENWLVPITT